MKQYFKYYLNIYNLINKIFLKFYTCNNFKYKGNISVYNRDLIIKNKIYLLYEIHLEKLNIKNMDFFYNCILENFNIELRKNFFISVDYNYNVKNQ